jgi:hypothetical protein
MHTILEQDSRALKFIKEGVDLIYGAVRRTLDPEARTTSCIARSTVVLNVDDGFYTAEVIVPRILS